MPIKVAIAGFYHETNTFSNITTGLDLFRMQEFVEGKAILDYYPGTGTCLGGIVDTAAELGVELVPSMSTQASPSGKVTREAFNLITDRIISGLRSADHFDGVCLALHGAGVAEHIPSIESEVLRRVREAVGHKIPVVATLDLHANLTREMVEYADALFGYNYYPHIDKHERGAEAFRYLYQIIEGKAHPAMAMQSIPMLASAVKEFHKQEPAKGLLEACHAWEKKPRVSEACIFYGFEYADIPHAGTSVVVITENDLPLAEQVAVDLASKIWSNREQLQSHIPKPPEAIRQALALPGQPIVVNDYSDNPGGGGATDATDLLRAMLDAGLGEKAAYGYIRDREAVDAVHKAGVGSTLDLKVGGKTDNLHGEPVSIRAYVRILCDGRYTITSPNQYGLKVKLGRSACLVIGPPGSSDNDLREGQGMELVVAEERFQVYDPEPFRIHGIDISQKKIIALKSSVHFRAAWEPISKGIVTAAGRGLTNPDITSFPFRELRRPLYSFDREIKFSPNPVGHPFLRT